MFAGRAMRTDERLNALRAMGRMLDMVMVKVQDEGNGGLVVLSGNNTDRVGHIYADVGWSLIGLTGVLALSFLG